MTYANVAIVEPVGGHGGMNYYDFGLAAGLSESGCKVFLYTCDETEVPDRTGFEVRLTYRNIYGNEHKLIRATRFIKAVFISLFDIKRNSIPIIHLHFFHTGAMEMLTISLAKLLNLRIIITVHDVESFSGDHSTALATRMFRAADRLIAHNIVSQQELISKIGVLENRISIIPHGNYIPFAISRPSKEKAREKFGIAIETEVLLCFGQIKQVKGLDILIDALEQIKGQHPNVLLLIAGKVWKDDFSKYQQMIDEKKIASFVKADIRYIPDEETPWFYAASDVVVLPYRRIYQSGVLLMAMSFECAVVASNLAGMSEVITEGKTGYLFENGDANSLGRALHRALANPEERDRIAKAGLQLMEDQYSWSSIGRKTRDVYQQVIRNTN